MGNLQLSAQYMADYYQFLAGGFLKEPVPRWLEGAKDAAGKLLQTGVCTVELSSLMDSLDQKQNFAQDYYDLMFVPQSGRYVPPFESAITNGYYRADGSYYYGNLAGEQETDVAGFYRQLGFRWQELDIYQPLKLIPFADHIGFELAFLGFLAYQEQFYGQHSENAESYRAWRNGFLTAHLGRWANHYADRVMRSGTSPFYRNLAALVSAFVGSQLPTQGQPQKDGAK